MAEILFTVEDRTNPDPNINSRLYKRGDVITAKPDGWQWSNIELTQSNWRIIRAVGMSLEDALALKQEEPGDPTGKPVWRRQFMIDINNVSLIGPVKDFIDDDTRQVPIFETNAIAVNALKVNKGPADAFFIIG